MRFSMPRRRRIVGLASLTSTLAFVALSLASSPAGAQTSQPSTSTCPVLSVSNPNPDDDLLAGGYIISGTAYDPNATQGDGIARVDFYLGDRDTGGAFIGSVVPGNVPGGDPHAFKVEGTVPNVNTGTDFVAYAISSVTGKQTTVEFPVLVGVPAVGVPTPVPTGETVTTNCPAGAAAAAPAPAMAAPAASAPAMAAPVAAAPAMAAATSACPVVSLANPNPDDDILPGKYLISGTAYDPAATQGAGIARIDFYLGERDSGGAFIGSAVPGNVPGGDPRAFKVETSVPNINTGLSFVAYAVSSVTGKQTTIEFPVAVGVPAVGVPTPAPSGETVTNNCQH